MNSGELIDYIRSMCQVSINVWSLLMGGLVLQSVELIPVHEIRFPVRSVAWSFNLQNRLYIRRILKV
jgi:hypothetical protein